MNHDEPNSRGRDLPPKMERLINWKCWLRRIVAVMLLVSSIGSGWVWWHGRGPQPPTEIFAGITYGCERLEASDEGSGLLHWARVDLTAPGIELYVTPLDPKALAQGWQYRLRWIKDVVEHEQLA